MVFLRNILTKDILNFYKKIIGSMITHGSGLVISFIASVLLTRSLGAEGRGIIAWVTSLSGIIAIVAVFGMETVNKRIAAEDPSRAGDLASFSILISFAASIIAIPAIYYFASSYKIGLENKATLLVGLLAIPAIATTKSLPRIFLGLHDSRSFNISTITQKIVNALLIIGLITLGFANPLSATIVISLSFFIQMIVIMFLLRKIITANFAGVLWIARNLKSYISINYLTSFLMAISSLIIPILLSYNHSFKSAGFFSAAMIIIVALLSIFEIAGFYVIPKLVSIKNKIEYLRLKRNVILTILIASSLAAILLYFTASWLIPFLFGKEFEQAIEGFKLLSISIIFFAVFNIIQSVITAQTKDYCIIISPLILASTTLLFSYLLIGNYGYFGASLARLLAGFCGMSTTIIISFFI